MIHEAGMIFTKKHWKATGGFIKNSQGEGTNMIDDMNDKTVGLTQAQHVIMWVCWNGNTICKDRFQDNKDLGAGKYISELDFKILKKPFIEEVASRVGGYDLQQTREYYHKVSRKKNNLAWMLLREDISGLQRKINFNPDWLLGYEGNFIEWFAELTVNLETSLSGEDLLFNLYTDQNQIASTFLDDITKTTYSLPGN